VEEWPLFRPLHIK